MHKQIMTLAMAVFGLALAPATAVLADGLPPAQAKPLSAILTAAQQGDARAMEAEFDNGRWEVTTCVASACQKHYFNAITGTEEGQKNTDLERGPDVDAPSIIDVVKRVEAADIGTVTDVDFDRGYWKVELAVNP